MKETAGRTGPELSIVVSAYNEKENIAALVAALTDALETIGIPYEVILVDDGSTDRTWEAIQSACHNDSRIRSIRLSRNFGHQNAMFAGLHYAGGCAVITMDSDLQHPPSIIPQLYSAWLEGYQIVETVRSESEDVTWFKRTTSRWFYKVFSVLSGIPMSSGTSDFRLMDARVVEVVREMKDADLFLRGIAHWVGFRRKAVPYEAINRHAGESKYTLARMIKFAVSSLISFSTIPLRLGIWIGLATSLLAFLELIYILIAYIRGNVVPGWASTLALVSFLFGILFLLVGIIGAYLASIFETLKNRPRFLVSDTAGFSDE